MEIRLNDILRTVPEGTTVGQLRDQLLPECDMMILNGFPVGGEEILTDGDVAVIYQKATVPPRERFEALMTVRHTAGVHDAVKRSCVGIAGLGGLGSLVAMTLTRLGIGRLVLADFDIVEPSNLNRQQYFSDQIGQKKTAALLDNLKRINPYLDSVTHDVLLTRDNFSDVFQGCDVVVECFDTAAAKRMAYTVARTVMKNVPFVMASGVAGHADTADIIAKSIADNVTRVGDGVTAAGQGVGLMSPRVTVAAGIQANVVLNLLLKKHGFQENPTGDGESRHDTIQPIGQRLKGTRT